MNQSLSSLAATAAVLQHNLTLTTTQTTYHLLATLTMPLSSSPESIYLQWYTYTHLAQPQIKDPLDKSLAAFRNAYTDPGHDSSYMTRIMVPCLDSFTTKNALLAR